jgi:hypothetical protein
MKQRLDPVALIEAARAYPAAARFMAKGTTCWSSCWMAISRDSIHYLASRGVYVSYLAPRNVSLEDVFMELTTDTPAPSQVTA